MIPHDEIVISVFVIQCRMKKQEIKELGIDINQLDDFDKIELYLVDAQKIGLISNELSC